MLARVGGDKNRVASRRHGARAHPVRSERYILRPWPPPDGTSPPPCRSGRGPGPGAYPLPPSWPSRCPAIPGAILRRGRPAGPGQVAPPLSWPTAGSPRLRRAPVPASAGAPVSAPPSRPAWPAPRRASASNLIPPAPSPYTYGYVNPALRPRARLRFLRQAPGPSSPRREIIALGPVNQSSFRASWGGDLGKRANEKRPRLGHARFSPRAPSASAGQTITTGAQIGFVPFEPQGRQAETPLKTGLTLARLIARPCPMARTSFPITVPDAGKRGFGRAGLPGQGPGPSARRTRTPTT